MQIRRLNFLRGLAALIVVVSHFSNKTGAWGQLLGRGAGQIGVMLFFMLSGFLMTYIYWKREASQKNLLLFFQSRLARVVPLYLFVVLVSYFFGWPYKIEGFQNLAAHLLFLSGTSVLWTIPPEVQFYSIFGLSWFFLRGRAVILILLMSPVFIVLLFFGFPRAGTIIILGLNVSTALLRALPYFMVGGLLGYLFSRSRSFKFRRSGWYSLSLLLIPLLFPKVFRLLFGFSHGMWSDVGILLIMTAIFTSIVFLVPNGNPLLENRIGDLLGKVSYSLYLLHLPVLSYVVGLKLPLSYGLQLTFFLILAASFSIITFYVIENPARKALRGYSSKKKSCW